MCTVLCIGSSHGNCSSRGNDSSHSCIGWFVPLPQLRPRLLAGLT